MACHIKKKELLERNQLPELPGSQGSLSQCIAIYNTKGIAIPAVRDNLFPMLALQYFGPLAGVVFVLGIIAATYASTDSALTALTTSFCIDILEFRNQPAQRQERLRFLTHIGFSVLFVIIVIIFRIVNRQSLIDTIFTMAGYTYGPLLGLYSFGLFTKRQVWDKAVPWVCLASPIICAVLAAYSAEWFGGYKFGFELLLLNGLITFLGLWGVRKSRHLNS
jgi:Na+/proline symporter